MTREPITNFYGHILGFYEYKSNGDIVLTDFSGRILGRYIESRDVTEDFYGRIVSHGNTLAMLLK